MMKHVRAEHRHAGQGALALVLWILGLALMGAPFLRHPDAPDPEGDDPGRALSEIDIPFAEDVAQFESEFDLPLGKAIEEASERWFGSESETMAGLVEVDRLDAGRDAYQSYCIGCHGSTGDGAGPAARHLEPRPRNFRKGVFKFTSTSTGEAPLPADIFQTLTRGLSGSSMPDFRLVSLETRWDLVHYVRYLAIRGSYEQLLLDIAWEDEELPEPDDLADTILRRWSPATLRSVYPPIPEPPYGPETVAHGRELFLSPSGANCVACHGEAGKGDGASAGDFRDDWGYPIRPRDLTTGVYRAGAEPAALYRSIATGVSGTPMPAYAGSLSPEDIWALVHFVQSLKEAR